MLRTMLRRGDPWIWLTGSALGACLLMILGLVGVGEVRVGLGEVVVAVDIVVVR